MALLEATGTETASSAFPRSGQKDATETATSVAVHPSTGAVYVTGDYYLKAATNWQVKRAAVGAVTL